MARETHGPWHVAAIKGNRIIGDETAQAYDKLQIHGSNATVATVYRAGDARLIVAAVNERAALREALRAFLTCNPERGRVLFPRDAMFDGARAALALGEDKP